MKDSPKVYGTVTMGTRGQVVIPIRARKTLKIQPGDRLLVMLGPPGHKEIISFVPVEDISQFLGYFEERFPVIKKEISNKNK